MPTEKTIALTRQTFVGKVMSLLFNMLSRCQEQPSFNFMASVTICSDFGTPKIKSVTVSTVSPSICHEVMGWDAMILVFWMLSFKPTFSLSSCTFIKRLLCSSLLSAIRVVSSAYLRLLIFLPAILIPVCASSSTAFLMMYSAYKLNKHGDNIQPWWTPFPIWNQSVIPCPVLTVASWPAYRFLRRQVRWSSIPSSLRIFHSLLWSKGSAAPSIVMTPRGPFLPGSLLLDQPTLPFLLLLFAWRWPEADLLEHTVLTTRGGTKSRCLRMERKSLVFTSCDPVGLPVPPPSSSGQITCVSLMKIIIGLL